jgi:exopolysaccharide biosynthesis polyprenyl glycosylphosphotransferase
VGLHPFWFLILCGVWLGVANAFDAYDSRVLGKLDTSVPAVVRAGVTAVLLYMLIPHITPPLPTSRLTLVSFPVLAVGMLSIGRVLYAWGHHTSVYEQRALIVGAGWAGRTVAGALLEDGQAGYRLMGFIDDDPQKTEVAVPAAEEPGRRPASLPVLGNRQTIKDWIQRYGVSTVILAITGEVDSDLLSTLMDCVEQGVELVPMPVIYEQLTGRVPVEHVGEKWYAAVPLYSKVTSPIWQTTKRVIDIAFSVVGLTCLLSVLPFIALAIVLDSPGPVLYTQVRVGKGGRPFRAYKFRSMLDGAENDRALWAQERDPRVTRVGRLLRAAHLDEFPQFLNVLRGEMSIVGPRPERPEFDEELEAMLPVYRLRHIVKPGMGGWGLIRQGYAGSPQAALTRLQYDLYYIKHQSLWLDTLIMLKTVMHAITLKGR